MRWPPLLPTTSPTTHSNCPISWCVFCLSLCGVHLSLLSSYHSQQCYRRSTEETGAAVRDSRSSLLFSPLCWTSSGLYVTPALSGLPTALLAEPLQRQVLSSHSLANFLLPSQGYHELAQPLYQRLSERVTVARFRHWLTGLHLFCSSQLLLSSSPNTSSQLVPALSNAAALVSKAAMLIKVSGCGFN